MVGLSGYAIGYDIFEGNAYEGNTLIPFFEKMSRKFNLNKPVVIADSGLLSKSNITALEENGYEYILGARIKYVLVVAHRGDWRNAPENSLLAIDNCIKMGVDIVEIDVRMTKDSVLVLMHDKTIDRTTSGKGKVSDWTLDSLKSLGLRNEANCITQRKIPTLEEAMLAARGKILVNVDKAHDYLDEVYQVLKKTETVNQAILKGPNNIDEVRRKYGTLLNEIIYMPVIFEKTPNLKDFVDDFMTEYHPVAFEVIYSSTDSPNFEIINYIKQQNSRIWVNTLWESLCAGRDDDRALEDPDGSWGWVIEHGANIIQTDRPALLLEYLKEKGLHE
ncbi:MAG: glycerophosphodiester phosphodiesterase family protein [Bacteroidota bacterium]